MVAVISTPQAADESAPWAVHLPGFDGPLDLLLHLIERNQLEITAISLVAVTDQFIAYLRMWDEPPLPRLAEFVTMAARLLLIKSRSLLPRQPRGGRPGRTGGSTGAETPIRPCWLIHVVVRCRAVRSSRCRWVVRVRSRGWPVHQASSRIRLMAAAAVLCSRRVLGRPR